MLKYMRKRNRKGKVTKLLLVGEQAQILVTRSRIFYATLATNFFISFCFF